MKRSYIYKDQNHDLFYVNNKGEEFLLTEAVSPLKRESHDLIVALKLNPKYNDDPENEMYYDTDADAVWFADASAVKYYFIGESDCLLLNCKMFLDDKALEQKVGKMDVFYTGGGIWICAMWIDEHHYIAIDNDWYADGFCIYDRREEDDDPEIEFPCEYMIGEKLKKDFTDEDKANYKRMKEALDKEVKQ